MAADRLDSRGLIGRRFGKCPVQRLGDRAMQPDSAAICEASQVGDGETDFYVWKEVVAIGVSSASCLEDLAGRPLC
jgi:hypothetical protein